MKRFARVLAILLGLVAITTATLGADGDERSVTGAANAVFAAGAELGPVALQGLEIGTGVFIEANGSASGAITLDGKVSGGSVAADGHATFSGTASLDLGDGLPPLPGVTFSVTAGADGVVLAIDSTTFPAAGLTAGAVTIE
jgi:hypothetical protein